MRFTRQTVLLCGVAILAAVSALAVFAADRPPITGIALVRIRVTDMKKSYPFYSKIIGLPEAKSGCFTKPSAAVKSSGERRKRLRRARI